MSFSSSEGSSQSAYVEPEAARLALSASGRETLRVAGAEVPVLRLAAALTGSPPPPLDRRMVEALPVDEEGARRFEVLVHAEAPHHVLLVRLGEREIRAYPAGAAALPDDAAPAWLVDPEAMGR